MQRTRKNWLTVLAAACIIGPGIAGCQSETSATPTSGAAATPTTASKGAITPTASGKQIDPEQQKFVNKEQESSAAGAANAPK